MLNSKQSVVVVIVLLLCAVIWIAISVPSMITPRIFLNHRQAVRSIQDLNLAERRYLAMHPGAGFQCTIGDLGEEGLVDRLTSSGTRSGYHLQITCPDNSSQHSSHYTITALPMAAGKSGKFALCSTESGEIWYSENGSAAECLAMRKPIERRYR